MSPSLGFDQQPVYGQPHPAQAYSIPQGTSESGNLSFNPMQAAAQGGDPSSHPSQIK